MKVFITGASGLLATNVIIQLLEKGYAVKALIRNKHKFNIPVSKNLELVEGNITNLQLLEAAVHGCDYIIHAAAETRQGLIHWKEYSKINIEGTRNVCEAAIQNGIKRVIYVGTANVFGFGSVTNPGDEKAKIRKPFSDSLYVKSKLEAQEIALSYINKTEVVVVNPSFLIGPYGELSGSGRIITRGYNKRLIFFPPGGKNFVHVADAATGIINALTKGMNGQKYILANKNLSYKEFYKKLQKYSQIKSMLIQIPKPVWLILGLIGNLLKYTGIKNEFTMTNMQILCVKNFYSNKKARIELGMKFNSIDQALDDFFAWYNLK